MHFPTSQVLNCNCIAFLITESWQQTEPWHSQTGFFLPLFASFTFWFISIFRKLLNISQTPPCFIKKKKSFHWTKVISGSARSAFSFSHTPNFLQELWILLFPICLNASHIIQDHRTPPFSELSSPHCLQSACGFQHLEDLDAVFAWTFAVRLRKLLSTDGMLKHTIKMT